MRTRLRFAPALAFTLGALLSTPPASGTNVSVVPGSFTGVWIRAGSAVDEVDRAQAIERATALMSPLVRSIARSVMRRSVRPVDRYEIGIGRPGLSIRADDEEPVSARLDGQRDEDPDALVRSHWREDGFEQIWRTDDATHGRTRWRIDDGLQRMSVTTHVEDARFSAPLVYTTHYERLD